MEGVSVVSITIVYHSCDLAGENTDELVSRTFPVELYIVRIFMNEPNVVVVGGLLRYKWNNALQTVLLCENDPLDILYLKNTVSVPVLAMTFFFFFFFLWKMNINEL